MALQNIMMRSNLKVWLERAGYLRLFELSCPALSPSFFFLKDYKKGGKWKKKGGV